MTERLKLTRGLADISPLFKKEEASRLRPQISAPIQAPTFVSKTVSAPEVCYIWSEGDEGGDAHFLNNFFASKRVSAESSALLLSFEDQAGSSAKAIRSESWNRFLRRISLSVTRLAEAFNDSSWTSESTEINVESQIFIEAKMDSLFGSAELVRSLDHIVFFLKPQVDSVTETYRKLKRLMALGMRAEVSILFDADDAGGLPARLYELFSDFVSRRLSLSINYLGTLHLSRGADGLRQDICWENWNAIRGLRTQSIDKVHFLAWIEKLSQEGVLK